MLDAPLKQWAALEGLRRETRADEAPVDEIELKLGNVAERSGSKTLHTTTKVHLRTVQHQQSPLKPVVMGRTSTGTLFSAQTA
jgi:hypothetical protein